MRRTAIGIDIGGTNLRAARISADGAIEERVGERISRDPAAVTRRVIELARALDRPDVAAIGIGVPGRVDARRRVVLSGGYLDLSGAAFAADVEAGSGKPVAIDNDCSMALAGEIAAGAGRGRANVVMFTIGTGIGGAIVLDGRIVRGRMTAGQLGHLTVDIDGEPCACGRRGCVETTSAGPALARWIAATGLPADTTVEDLFRLDAAGDARAGAALDKWARPLRAAIDSVVAVVAPDLVLLGGGLGHAAHRALEKAPPASAWFECPIDKAALGDDAGVIGAGFAALTALDDAAAEPARREFRGAANMPSQLGSAP